MQIHLLLRFPCDAPVSVQTDEAQVHDAGCT